MKRLSQGEDLLREKRNRNDSGQESAGVERPGSWQAHLPCRQDLGKP